MDEVTQETNYLIFKLFDYDLNREKKQDMLEVVFSKYILPNMESFIPVKEETYFNYKRTGPNMATRWHDRRNNAYFLMNFDEGPWFLVVDPPNYREYGAEQLPNKYYELPNFEININPILLQERELFG